MEDDDDDDEYSGDDDFSWKVIVRAVQLVPFLSVPCIFRSHFPITSRCYVMFVLGFHGRISVLYLFDQVFVFVRC